MPGVTISAPTASKPALRVIDGESGAPIFDRAGQKVAVLKYLVCDAQNSRPRYAVLSSDGFLGPGEDCRPVPAILLSRPKDRPGYVLRVDREKYLDGPRYLADGGDEDSWWHKADDYYHEGVLDVAAAHEPRLVRE